MANKTYRGDRTIDGAQVTVDGQELDPRLDLRTFTDHGIEWSYEGDGPRQLALAMLAVHFNDDSKALAQCENFMSRIVANFGNEWEMTSKDIDNALANISADA